MLATLGNYRIDGVSDVVGKLTPSTMFGGGFTETSQFDRDRVRAKVKKLVDLGVCAIEVDFEGAGDASQRTPMLPRLQEAAELVVSILAELNSNIPVICFGGTRLFGDFSTQFTPPKSGKFNLGYVALIMFRKRDEPLDKVISQARNSYGRVAHLEWHLVSFVSKFYHGENEEDRVPMPDEDFKFILEAAQEFTPRVVITPMGRQQEGG